MRKQTKAIRLQTERTDFNEHATPLFLTSSFVFDDAEHGRGLFDKSVEGNIYSRFTNPSVQEFIDKVCMLEEAEDGLAMTTGMAAVFAGFAGLLQAGDHIVSSKALFGSAHQLISQILPKWGITYTYVEADATEAEWEAAVQPATKMLYLETPSNPGLAIIDLEMVGRVAKKHGLIYYIDNCFATPILQVPTRYGADLIAHSATKFMDGQGRVLGGVLVGRKEIMEPIRFFARQTGPVMSPFNAWVLSKSLETLELRMERHCANALALATAMQQMKDYQNVNYPFLETHPQYELAKKQMTAGGALITFEVEGGFETVNKLSKLLKIPSLTSNLGDSRTTLTNPFTTTHSSVSVEEKLAIGITEGLMRMSVGLEDVQDLIEDFKQAGEQL